MSSTAASGHTCPHCGDSIETTLPIHMTRDCDARETFDPHAEWDDVDAPLLEEAPATIDVDDDLDERRGLADELTAAGVWVGN